MNFETILQRLPDREDDLYTLEEIAEALGVKRNAVARAKEDLPFEPVRKGRGRGGQIFYSREQIALALLANCMPAPRQKRA